MGFLVGLDYESNDRISRDAAAEIIETLPPFVSSVLVTHRVELAWVVKTARAMRCSTVQLHGDFPLPDIPRLREALPHVRVSRVAHVEHERSVAEALEVSQWADAVHLDSRTETRLGGTGLTHDWALSERIARQATKPVVLAGGLTPANVGDAIEVVRPFAVDVNSGVDDGDGPEKSPDRLHAFGDAVRRASVELTPIG